MAMVEMEMEMMDCWMILWISRYIAFGVLETCFLSICDIQCMDRALRVARIRSQSICHANLNGVR
jgi:hypothetical protein